MAHAQDVTPAAAQIAAAQDANGYWRWSPHAPGYEAYKNDILTKLQDAITVCGIPTKDQQVFVEQPMQENGALNPTLTGGTDRGYSYGIGQWNVSPMSARTYLHRNPTEADINVQIHKLAGDDCDAYKKWNGDLWKAIVEHNCPTCARIRPGEIIGGHGYSYWHAVGENYWTAVNAHKEQLVYL